MECEKNEDNKYHLYIVVIKRAQVLDLERPKFIAQLSQLLTGW